MLRRTLVVTGAFVLLLVMALPAAATTQQDGPGVLQICRDLRDTRPWFNPGTGVEEPLTAYWIPLAYPDGTVEDFPIQGLRACTTTLRGNGGTLPVPYNRLSTLAYNGQCRLLESTGAVVYPYDFYGNPAYHAENRADCIYFLRAFHTGALPPGPPQ